MANRMNILFDAKIFIEYYFGDMRYLRGGVFYVAYNVFKKLKEQTDINITLAYGLEYRWSKRLKKIKKDIFFKNLNFVCIDKFTECDYYKVYAKCYFANLSLLSIIKMAYNISKYFFLKFLEIYFCYLCNNKKEIEKHHIYFSPFHAIPKNIKKNDKIKKFIIIYDAIDLFEKDMFIRERYRIIPNSVDKQTYVFFISKCTRDDFLNYYKNKFDRDKTFICYIASSNNFIPDYDRNKLNMVLKRSMNNDIVNKYALSICSMHPRKNVPFTIECFLKFISKNIIDDLYFYLAGASLETIKNGIRPILQNFPKYNDKIVILGYIQDKDMNLILSNALFFVYLSKYEGFGMPPLEAMQAGTPVITSNNSSLPEVVGDAAISVDCEDENAVIKAFEDLYYNKDLRTQYIEKGLEQAKFFNWNNTTKIMINAFYNSLGLSVFV